MRLFWMRMDNYVLWSTTNSYTHWSEESNFFRNWSLTKYRHRSFIVQFAVEHLSWNYAQILLNLFRKSKKKHSITNLYVFILHYIYSLVIGNIHILKVFTKNKANTLTVIESKENQNGDWEWQAPRASNYVNRSFNVGGAFRCQIIETTGSLQTNRFFFHLSYNKYIIPKQIMNNRTCNHHHTPPIFQ